MEWEFVSYSSCQFIYLVIDYEKIVLQVSVKVFLSAVGKKEQILTKVLSLQRNSVVSVGVKFLLLPLLCCVCLLLLTNEYWINKVLIRACFGSFPWLAILNLRNLLRKGLHQSRFMEPKILLHQKRKFYVANSSKAWT